MVKANIMDGNDGRSPGVPFPGHCDSAMRSVEQVLIVILSGVEQGAGQGWARGHPCQVGAGAPGVLGAHWEMKRGCYLEKIQGEYRRGIFNTENK